jgi:hypothetical protein
MLVRTKRTYHENSKRVSTNSTRNVPYERSRREEVFEIVDASLGQTRFRCARLALGCVVQSVEGFSQFGAHIGAMNLADLGVIVAWIR